VGELEKYKIDLVVIQEVRWEGEGYQMITLRRTLRRKGSMGRPGFGQLRIGFSGGLF
jgi:hypothetical protein